MGQAPDSDVLAERPVAEPTVLSTVWEGQPRREPADNTGDHPRTLDLESNRDRTRLLDWLLAPASRQRVLIITTMAALICGSALAVGGVIDVAPPRASSDTDSATFEPDTGNLTSRAVVADASDQVAETEPTIRHATSADGRLRLTAQRLQTEAGSWMLEAESVDPADPAPVVRFTVNGVMAQEVDRAPYRFLLNSEILSAIPGVAVDGQPWIVTASASWPDGTMVASPATLVVSN